MPFKAFCYGCKKFIVAPNMEEFHKSGHVATRDEAKNKYHINTNRLHKDVVIGK